MIASEESASVPPIAEDGLQQDVGNQGCEELKSLGDMAVVIVSPWHLPTVGGVAMVAERLRTWLIRAGIPTQLLVSDGATGSQIAPDGTVVWHVDIPGYVFGSLRPRSILGMLYRAPHTVAWLLRFFRDHQIRTTLLLYPIEHAWPFVLLRTLTSTRLIVSLHGDDVRLDAERTPMQRWLLQRTLHRADDIIVCATHLADAARAICPGITAPIHHIPNCVDALHFAPRTRPRSDGGLTIVHASAFATTKRTCDIVEAFARATLPEGTRLVMVGGGFELEATRQRARDLGVADRVEFAGPQGDVRPYLWNADLFVLASDAEGAPLALLEAMACGIPWVSTPWGVAADLPAGECGFTVPPRDPDQMARALTILTFDDERRRAMGKRARERILSDYTEDAYVRRHIDLLVPGKIE